MNKYVTISLICLAIAFGGILSQHGHANTITYASVVPGVLWVLFLLLKAGQGWLADRRADKARKLNSFALPLLLSTQLPVSNYQLAIAIGLLILAYVAKAAIDNLTHQAGNSIFEKWGAWFDARVSWLNKYKAGSWEAGAPVPRFSGSTTVFVWLTDFWHAADSVYLTAYLVGAMLLGAWLGPVQAWPWLLAIVLVKGAGGGVFQLCYRLFRIKT
jgi:hypothetical protein